MGTDTIYKTEQAQITGTQTTNVVAQIYCGPRQIGKPRVTMQVGTDFFESNKELIVEKIVFPNVQMVEGIIVVGFTIDHREVLGVPVVSVSCLSQDFWDSVEGKFVLVVRCGNFSSEEI